MDLLLKRRKPRVSLGHHPLLMQGQDPNQNHPLVIGEDQDQSLDHQLVIGEDQGPSQDHRSFIGESQGQSQDHQSVIGEGGGLALIHLCPVSNETVGPDHLCDLIIVQDMKVNDVHIEIGMTMTGVADEIRRDRVIVIHLFRGEIGVLVLELEN